MKIQWPNIHVVGRASSFSAAISDNNRINPGCTQLPWVLRHETHSPTPSLRSTYESTTDRSMTNRTKLAAPTVVARKKIVHALS